MLTYQTRRAVGRLAADVASLRPLTDILDQPIRVAPVHGWPTALLSRASGPATVAAVLDRIAGRTGPSSFVLAPGSTAAQLGTFERVVSEHLRIDAIAGAVGEVPRHALPEVDTIVDDVAAESFDGLCRRELVPTPDGALLPAYAAGDPGSPAMVLTAACGMPARLSEGWMRWLAKEHFVLTWETRGLFGRDLESFDAATDITAQSGDLLTVMDHFGVPEAHVVGLCAGSVIALAMADRAPGRVLSLSLWHGGYDLGDAAPKTDHHRNLKALIAMVVGGRVSATAIHASLSESTVAGVPPDLAHLVLYPYATPEVLYRYCVLNGAIMDADARRYLSPSIPRTLVVTSTDDRTAHPEQSTYVAAHLPDARLMVRPSGDHLSLFRAGSDLLRVASDFAAGMAP